MYYSFKKVTNKHKEISDFTQKGKETRVITCRYSSGQSCQD